ncbi:MAG: DegT/DnrJ/EryC1/StrS family aminotransferase [Elusimicrobiota bacterium]
MEKFKEPVYVTRPSMPPLREFVESLEKIWDSRWLTNAGPFHQELEKALAGRLGVKYLSLFSNGTLALITALQALRIRGEVITTPYSFVATTHSLKWNGIKPVFVDIEPEYLNIDPGRIEAAITSETTAILPVHVYGNPCDTAGIQRIADAYDLKVIYDAAHAFGTKRRGNSILNCGDLSILSFHATKVFSTIEGGAIVCHDEKMKRHIDDLKNFGFRDEVTVVASGINAKMNELQAAYGLLQLKYIDEWIAKNKAVSDCYRARLGSVEGLGLIPEPPGCSLPYSYFPVLIDSKEYGMTRDELYEKLKEYNVFGRRYFYPLISSFSSYRDLPSAAAENLPVAVKTAGRILCLPIYGDLALDSVERICDMLGIFRR